MENNPVLETRGVILKEEHVKSLSSNVVEDSLVLENTGAFPGYYGEDIPDTHNPGSLFIMIDKKYEGIFLARCLQKISRGTDHKCYGSFGTVMVRNKILPCIRIKNLDCFSSVIKIQMAIRDQGIGLMNYQKTDELALIRIHKSFLIKEVADGIFLDLFEPNRYYFVLPYPLEWDTFKTITRIVKSNLENNLFDAALGFLWRISGLTDIVRVYDPMHDLSRIRNLKIKYEQEMIRFHS